MNNPPLGSAVLMKTSGKPTRAFVASYVYPKECHDSAPPSQVVLRFDDASFGGKDGTRVLYYAAFVAALDKVTT